MGVRFSPLLPRSCNRDWRCDARSFNGRTRAFEARNERSIRSPAAKLCVELRGVVKADGYFSFQEHTVSECSLLDVARSFNWLGWPALTRLMHVRIVPSQPFETVAESGGRMPDCLSGGTGSTPVATAMGVRTRQEGRWSPKPVLAGSNPATPARSVEGRAWYSGWCLGPPTR